jgi:hypothetical protein
VTRLRQGYGVASELMNSDKLAEFAKRYAKAWCSHDPEKVAAFFAENGSLSVNEKLIAQSEGHFETAEYERQLKHGVDQ